MTRYIIQVETYWANFYLRKEYESLPQCMKAIKMINFATYGNCVARVYKFVNDYRQELIDTIVK